MPVAGVRWRWGTLARTVAGATVREMQDVPDQLILVATLPSGDTIELGGEDAADDLSQGVAGSTGELSGKLLDRRVTQDQSHVALLSWSR